MWDDIPEPLMLAAQTTAIFAISFIIFTAVKMRDETTDEGVNGVCTEHAKSSIASRASHTKTKHKQNGSCHDSHGSDTPTGSGQALRRKKALESCTTRCSREPSSRSVSQSPNRVGDGTRSSPTRLRLPKPGAVLDSYDYKEVDGQQSRLEDIGDRARGQSPVKRTTSSQGTHLPTNPSSFSATISSDTRLFAQTLSDESLSCAISSRRATKLAGLAPSPHSLDLAASLKMRCAISGCDYALLWRQCEKKRAFVVVGAYVTSMYREEAKGEGKTGTFAEASRDVALQFDGQSAVVRSFHSRRWQQIMFINVDNCDFFDRREQAVHHGIKSIGFTPCPQLQGVVEFGSRSAGQESARGFKAHGADHRAPEDQFPRVDLSASDSSPYRRDIPMRFDEGMGLPQWTSYTKSHFPKHWAQTEDDTEGNKKPALQQGQRQQVKQKDTQDLYQQQHPTHVSKRHSADLQVRNSFLSQSLSMLDGDRHAQHRDKTRQAQDVPQKGMVLSNSSAMLALYGKEYKSVKQQFQHIEKLAKNFAVPKNKGLFVSCGVIWEDGDDAMMELSPGKRRLIWGTVNDNQHSKLNSNQS